MSNVQAGSKARLYVNNVLLRTENERLSLYRSFRGRYAISVVIGARVNQKRLTRRDKKAHCCAGAASEMLDTVSVSPSIVPSTSTANPLSAFVFFKRAIAFSLPPASSL